MQKLMSFFENWSESLYDSQKQKTRCIFSKSILKSILYIIFSFKFDFG